MMTIDPKVKRLGRLTLVVGLIATAWILVFEPGGPLDFMSLVLPVLTGILVLASLYSAFRSMDELQRRIHLEALAAAFSGITLLAFIQIGMDEMGRPFTIRPGLLLLVLDGLWLAGYAWARRRYQ